jgi:hypothetical protein
MNNMLYCADVEKGNGASVADMQFLYGDIMNFRSLWLSLFSKESTLDDICTLLLALRNHANRFCSPQDRLFFRLLFRFLESDDVSFLKKFIWRFPDIQSYLQPTMPKTSEARLDTIASARREVTTGKNVIGSGPGWMRRLSISFPVTMRALSMTF